MLRHRKDHRHGGYFDLGYVKHLRFRDLLCVLRNLIRPCFVQPLHVTLSKRDREDDHQGQPAVLFGTAYVEASGFTSLIHRNSRLHSRRHSLVGTVPHHLCERTNRALGLARSAIEEWSDVSRETDHEWDDLSTMDLISRRTAATHVGVGPRGRGLMHDRLPAVGGNRAWH